MGSGGGNVLYWLVWRNVCYLFAGRGEILTNDFKAVFKPYVFGVG